MMWAGTDPAFASLSGILKVATTHTNRSWAILEGKSDPAFASLSGILIPTMKLAALRLLTSVGMEITIDMGLMIHEGLRMINRQTISSSNSVHALQCR
jgi:hypothetical protein